MFYFTLLMYYEWLFETDYIIKSRINQGNGPLPATIELNISIRFSVILLKTNHYFQFAVLALGGMRRNYSTPAEGLKETHGTSTASRTIKDVSRSDVHGLRGAK